MPLIRSENFTPADNEMGAVSAWDFGDVAGILAWGGFQ